MNAFILHSALVQMEWGKGTPWTINAEFEDWCENNFKGKYKLAFLGQDAEHLDSLMYGNYWFFVELEEDALLLKLTYSDDLRQI